MKGHMLSIHNRKGQRKLLNLLSGHRDFYRHQKCEGVCFYFSKKVNVSWVASIKNENHLREVVLGVNGSGVCSQPCGYVPHSGNMQFLGGIHL